MAAHRYWRLMVLENIAGPSGGANYNYTSLTELEMFEVLAGTNVCTGGTAIANSDYTAVPPWSKSAAFDGIKLVDTGWAANNTPPPVWIGYDFGSGNDKEIVQFAITVRSDGGGLSQAPKTFVLQFSDDNVWWYNTQLISNVSSWSANETRTYNISHEPPSIFLQSNFKGLSKFVVDGASSRAHVNQLFSGEGEISGKITVDETPVAGAPVHLHHSESGNLIRSTVSDALGDYEFLNLKRNTLYDVVAEDPDKEWEKRVSSRREPYAIANLKLPSRDGGVVRFDLKTEPAFRYYRLWIPVTENMNSYVNLDKIQLRDSPGGTNLCVTHAATGTATQSSQYNSDYGAEKAFEESSDFWHTASQSPPFWAKYDFGSGNAYKVVELGLQGFGVAGRQPKDFSLEGSNDDTTWETIASWTGVTGWDTTTIRTFTW